MNRLLACAALVLAAGCQNEVPILTYHWMQTGSDLQWDLETDRFREEMDELVARGCTAITLDQLYDYLDGKGSLPRRPVLITFDDGEANFYRVAYPILKERGLKATMFLISDLIADGPDQRIVWTSSGHQMPMLVWPEVLEMAGSGVVDFESHTRTHPSLPKIPLDQAKAEIEGSKQILEAKLGRPVRYLAYPGHGHNQAVMDLVRNAGYRGAVDGGNRIGGRFDLFRMSVERGTPLVQFRQLLSENWADAYSDPASTR